MHQIHKKYDTINTQKYNKTKSISHIIQQIHGMMIGLLFKIKSLDNANINLYNCTRTMKVIRNSELKYWVVLFPIIIRFFRFFPAILVY